MSSIYADSIYNKAGLTYLAVFVTISIIIILSAIFRINHSEPVVSGGRNRLSIFVGILIIITFSTIFDVTPTDCSFGMEFRSLSRFLSHSG